MSDYLDRNSDFSGYRASRKTASGGPLSQYAVGIVYYYYAEDEDHAVEQFLNANGDLGSVNYVSEVF